MTLALGIGATTAMFTVVNALLLHPLPFQEPDRLVAITEYDTRTETATAARGALPYPDFVDIRDRSHSLDLGAELYNNSVTATGAGPALHVEVEHISSNLFPILGAQPALGRNFRVEEDDPGHRVVILSNAFWRAHYNADTGAIGRSLDLDGHPYTIIGVMPAGFQYPISSKARDMWLTMSMVAAVDSPGDEPMTHQRGNHSFEVTGRLKPGVTLARANAELESIAHALNAEYPGTDKYTGIHALPEVEYLVGDTRPALFILLGAVGLVLLIACANVANLILARGIVRGQELAIRAALGASRKRITGQLLIESTLLSFSGAACGVVVAMWLLAAMVQLYPANLPRAGEIEIDAQVLLFTAGVAILTSLLSGLVPALRMSTPDLASTMREGGRTSTSGTGHNRLRSALVVAQTALSLMLLIGAGLLIRSFAHLSTVSLGFNPSHVLTANFDLSDARYTADQQDRFVREYLSRIQTLPGVVSVAGAITLPLYNDRWSVSFNPVDHPVPQYLEPDAGFYVVTPGFFETMQIPIVRGRAFSGQDQRNAAPVMMISESFAEKFFPREDPIGHKLKIGAGEGSARARYKTREIIGVAADIRTSKIGQAPPPAFYVPLPQLMWHAPTLLIRTAGEPESITAALHQTLVSMDPTAPLYAVKPLEDYLALSLGRARFQTVLLGLFAGIALLLTAVGLYGLIAFAVTQRTQEIGVRMALGASPGDVLRLVLQRGLLLTGIGVIIGLSGAVTLARLGESFLFQTTPHDPLTYLSVCVTLCGAALLATVVPALRATKVDPMTALRCN